tara:strand:- start:3068 stop:3220 length:153 start_codon:yes stop_codon:yes gene_type:complete
MANCEHINTEYIPPEEDIGVYENYICLDCGINLPLPEEWECHFESIKHEK